MAEGYIYILFNRAFQHGQYKIGKTTQTPEARAIELSAATGVPRPFEVLYKAHVTDCDRAERLVHQYLRQYRSSGQREFFDLGSRSVDIAIEAIRRAAEEVGRVRDAQEGITALEPTSDRHAEAPQRGEIDVIATDRQRQLTPRRPPGQIVTFEDHAAYTDAPRREILTELRRKILAVDDRLRQGEHCTPGQRIAYKIPGSINFMEVKVQRKAIVLYLADGGAPDPGGIATPIPETHGWGQFKKSIKITASRELDAAIPFIEAAFRAINQGSI